MKTLLVTGGAGFIGANFVLDLLGQGGYRVVNLDALTYAGNLDTLAPVRQNAHHKFAHGDIGDGPLVQKLLAEHRPAAIVNFAAESHVDRSIDGPAAFVQTNVVGTLNLLECALVYWRALPLAEQDAFRFLHVSTDEVYGSLGPVGRFSESTPYAPNSPYSASKAASDHLVRAFHHTYGCPRSPRTARTTTGRTSSREAHPADDPEGAQVRAAAGLRRRAQRARLAVRARPRPGDPGRARARAPGEVYNVGGDAERENIQVVRTILKLVDERRPLLQGATRDGLVSYVKDRPGHDRPLRDRRGQDQARARLGAERDVRVRHRAHRGLVPRQPGLGGARDGRQLPRRAPRRRLTAEPGLRPRPKLQFAIHRGPRARMSTQKGSSWPAAPAPACTRSP
jgi:dTDP-glucose 4,6-dehydratase